MRIRRIVNRLSEVVEIIRDRGFVFFIRRFIYCDTVTVFVEKNLEKLNDLADYPVDSGLVLTDISLDILKRSKFSFPVKSEYFRALNYIDKGYHGYALMREQHIRGYIWYANLGTGNERTIHPEADLFGIARDSDAAYMFSMYIDPKERGKNLATYLQMSPTVPPTGLYPSVPDGVCCQYPTPTSRPRNANALQGTMSTARTNKLRTYIGILFILISPVRQVFNIFY
jgi:hypothetical protein